MAVSNVNYPGDAWATELEPTLKQTATVQMICVAFSFVLFSIRMQQVIKENKFSHVFQYPAVFLGAFYMLLHFWNYLHYFVASDAMQRDIWLITMVSMTISKNFIYLFLMLHQSSLKLGCGTMFYLIILDAVHISQWVMTILMITDIHLTPSATHELSYRTFGERGMIGLCGYNLIDALSVFITFLIFWRKTKFVTDSVNAVLFSVNVVFGNQLLCGVFILFGSMLVFFVGEFVKVSFGITPSLHESTDHSNIYRLCVSCYTKLIPLLAGAYLLVALAVYSRTFTFQIPKILAFVSGLCNHVIQKQFRRAVQSERTELIQQMVLHHPTLHLPQTTFENGDSVLHMAATQRNHHLMHYWTDMGLPPDQQNEKGDTALHIASRLGDASAVSLLMKCGADTKIPNHEKESAFSLAQLGGYKEIMNALSPPRKEPVVITQDEVHRHKNMKDGVWIIIGGFVYDITQFLKNMLHPAGKAAIKPYYGRDATAAFEAVFHSKDALQLLKTYEIGRLPPAAAPEPKPQPKPEPELAKVEAIKEDMIAAPLPSENGKIWVSSLFIYPVKGCGGFRVGATKLTQSGFADDRIYGFVHKASNTVINQLSFPRMSLIRVAFKSGCENCDDGIQLNDYFVPFIKEKALKVKWRSCTTPILVWDQGEAVSQWITAFLAPDLDAEDEDEFILVRLHEDNYRETEEYFAHSFAPRSEQNLSGFQNYAAVLVGSEESLTELNRRYKKRYSMVDGSRSEEKEIDWDRFRMNIILSGVPTPHYEDFMKHITFGDEAQGESAAEILWSRRRYYCATPSVNQKKGIQTSEPISTCRVYRNAITLNDRTSLPGDDAVFFGSFYGVKHSGSIEVGQSVFCEGHLSNAYEECELIWKQQYNENVIVLRFKMVMKEAQRYHMSLKQALRIGDHYLLKCRDSDGNTLIRPYTPLFDDDNECELSFDLMVKVYENGKMSSHLNRMQCGDTILCKKNHGKICYTEPGKVRFGDPRVSALQCYTMNVRKLNLIAAGSGITPMYQIVCNIHLNRKVDSTEVVCVYANVSMEDILLRDELMDIAHTNPRVTIHFVVEDVEVNSRDLEQENVHILKGRISEDMCRQYLFPPAAAAGEVATLLCGPPPMEDMVHNYISSMGYDEKSVSTF